MVTLAELVIADTPDAWEALGFDVEGDACRVGAVTLRLAGPERGDGIVEWSLAGADAAPELDGLPTRLFGGAAAPPEPVQHPNGALQIDHVVVSTGDLDTTIASLEAGGIELRRLAAERAPRMAFFRLGEVILEVVEREPAAPTAFWGLVVVVPDLDALAADLGERLSPVHEAVQQGRRIATVRELAGVSPALAFMSPPHRA